MNLPVEIDRRQKLVAALMICGFDLPQELDAAAKQMLAASDVCPDLKADEVPMQGSRNRRLCLARARMLIDEMLEEIDTPQSTAVT